MRADQASHSQMEVNIQKAAQRWQTPEELLNCRVRNDERLQPEIAATLARDGACMGDHDRSHAAITQIGREMIGLYRLAACIGPKMLGDQDDLLAVFRRVLRPTAPYGTYQAHYKSPIASSGKAVAHRDQCRYGGLGAY